MQDTTADLFLSMSITFAIFGVCYYYLTTRNKERMMLIERNLPSDYFKRSHNYLPFILLIGIISIGIASGIFLGGMLESLHISGFAGFVLPGSIFFFLGVSLVIAYFVLQAIQKRE